MNSISSEEELKKFPRPIRKGAKKAPKIMHFGPGAFFRSFVASLIDKVNQYDIEKWGIVAVSLNSENTFDKLEGQDFVFNALSISSDKNQIQQVSSISNIFVAKKEFEAYLINSAPLLEVLIYCAPLEISGAYKFFITRLDFLSLEPTTILSGNLKSRIASPSLRNSGFEITVNNFFFFFKILSI